MTGNVTLWDLFLFTWGTVSLRPRTPQSYWRSNLLQGWWAWPLGRRTTHMSSNTPCFLKALFPPTPQASIMALNIPKTGALQEEKGGCHVWVLPQLAQGQKQWLFKWQQVQVKCSPHFKKPEHLQLFIKPVRTKDTSLLHCRQRWPAVLWPTQATDGHRRAKALTVLTSSLSKHKAALVLLLSDASCSERYYSNKGKQPY